MASTMLIQLNNLQFTASHGVYEQERAGAASFKIDLKIYYATDKRIIVAHQTIDYAEVYEVLKETFSETEEILEVVAQNCADALKRSFPQIEKLALTITKEQPPIAGFNGTFSVTYVEDFR